MSGNPCRLALLVNAAPYGSREPRAELDAALAALSLDFRLEVFFQGAAVFQLARGMEPVAALLPKGYLGWAALGELGEVRLFAEDSWIQRCAAERVELIGPPSPLPGDEMARRWRRCDKVWSL